MTDRARMALMEHISADHPPSGRPLWLAGVPCVAVAAAAAVALFTAGSGAGSSPPHAAFVSPDAGAAPTGRPSFVLQHLAHSVAQAPALPGNATLVKRTSNIVNSGQVPSSLTGYDLYQDNGSYYWGPSLTALRSTVSHPSPSDVQDKELGQVVAAAAASADLTPSQAAVKLLAAMPHATPQVGQGTPPLTQAEANTDLQGIEWAAIGSALEGGPGQPQVRAGALLAAAALPNTTVTSTTDGGRPVIKVTYLPGLHGLVESLTVDGQTGILLNQYSGGDAGGSVSNTTYEVRRVTAPGLDAVR